MMLGVQFQILVVYFALYDDVNDMLYFYKYGEIFMFHCFHLYITQMRINMLERTLHTMVGEGKLYDTKTTKIRQLKG